MKFAELTQEVVVDRPESVKYVCVCVCVCVWMCDCACKVVHTVHVCVCEVEHTV